MKRVRIACFLFLLITGLYTKAQTSSLHWNEVTDQFGPLPQSIKVFASDKIFKDSNFVGYYVSINTKDKKLDMGADTTLYRRFTPQQFYTRIGQPYVVVNSSFFEFVHNTNVNIVVKEGVPVSYNIHSIPAKGKDTLTYTHVLGSALGMDKKGKIDVVYTYTDSNSKEILYQQTVMKPFRDSNIKLSVNDARLNGLTPWKVKWANGGGPVLMSEGQIHITNDDERKFAGKAILDYHPRTAMGYKKDGTLIIMAIQGRMKGIAAGITLTELANLFQELGCYEAINLDGGGSSCLLVNGKETIKPSDATGQRPVPAVFYVKTTF